MCTHIYKTSRKPTTVTQLSLYVAGSQHNVSMAQLLDINSSGRPTRTDTIISPSQDHTGSVYTETTDN